MSFGPSDRAAALSGRGEMTADELAALAEITARELLGMSAGDAFALLDSGQFAGQAVEGTLLGIKRLLSA